MEEWVGTPTEEDEMRAIWKGAVAFGLVNVPVKLYAATGEHSVPLHQVHAEDGGRIRYRKVCSVCGQEIAYQEIAKGYETDDGQMVVLDDEDLAGLPLSTEREIAVEEFVPADQVDPIMLGKTYYLEPEKTAAKAYVLLREALQSTDRMAVVKVALRQRESMAVLRVRDDVICLQTLLWPDEVREADFPVLDTEVKLRPQEVKMASSLVESLAADFDPSEFEDSYQAALESLIEAKVSSGGTVPTVPARDEEEGAEVVDLLSALQRSVQKARDARGEGGPAGVRAAARKAPGGNGTAPASQKPAAPEKPAAKKSGTAKPAAQKRSSTPKKTASAKTPSKTAAKKPAEKKPATRRRAS